MPWNEKAEHIMAERFGKDTIIPLATVENGIPYVRNVNAFYEDGSFYVITHALSNKMRHIRENPTVAITGEALLRAGSTTATTILRMRTQSSCAWT